MRVLFDTSVLIAGFITTHPKHNFALPWLQRAHAKKIEYLVSSHSIAECYSVLTRLPISPKISSVVARNLIRENIEKLAEIINLTSTDYLTILKQMTELDLTGGIIYDAIILKAAKKGNADKLLTINPNDFKRLAPNETSFFINS